MQFSYSAFPSLSPEGLYQILQLRQRVFSVEQNCAYLDLDDLDQQSLHLCGREGLLLMAYLRLLPPGLKFSEASIGRVVTAPEARGKNVGRELLRQGLKIAQEKWPGPIRISAQAYLEKFYGEFGFRRAGENYLEDGIPHLEMLRAAP